MKELSHPDEFDEIKSLDKPFGCPRLIVLPEYVRYRNYDRGGYILNDLFFREGELVCRGKISYCSFSGGISLNENGELETKCAYGNKFRFKVEGFEAPRKRNFIKKI